MSAVRPTRRRLLAAGLALPAAGLLASCTEPESGVEKASIRPKRQAVAAVLDARASNPPGTSTLAVALAQQLTDAQVSAYRTHSEQVAAIKAAVRQDVGVLVVQAIDPTEIGPHLAAAKKADVTVMTLDALPSDVSGVALALGWDWYSMGEQEIQRAAKAMSGKPPHHVELFAGPVWDLRAKARMEGQVSTLKPMAREGDFIVKTGQTAFDTAALKPGDTKSLARRLTTTYEVTYPRHRLDTLVIPHDQFAEQALATARKLKRPAPKLISSGATETGVKGVMDGSFLSTQYHDPTVLAGRAAKLVETLRHGGDVDYNPQTSYRNEARTIPGIFVAPKLVTKANAAEALGSNPVLAPLTR